MTIIELMTALSASQNMTDAASAAVNSGIAGAKEVYMAWGKSEGHAVKDLEQVWKEAQPAKASGGPRGFADMYYDWLAEASRSEQEAHDLIMSNESQNVRNHLTHYLNIWALAESVRSGHKVSRTISAGKATPKAGGSSAKQKAEPKEEPKDTWEYNAANPFADVRSAWETLEREVKAKRPRKTMLHPDKVAKFGDDALTTAFTKAFQTYSKGR